MKVGIRLFFSITWKDNWVFKGKIVLIDCGIYSICRNKIYDNYTKDKGEEMEIYYCTIFTPYMKWYIINLK